MARGSGASPGPWLTALEWTLSQQGGGGGVAAGHNSRGEAEAQNWDRCGDLGPRGDSARPVLTSTLVSDLKLHLQSTDYGNFLANEASPLTVSVIDDRLKEKMVVEFRHMRNHAYEPLASFLDFIT